MMDVLRALADEFWAWRTATAPDSRDDIVRMDLDRPPGWRADWSADAVAARRRSLGEFVARHRDLDLSGEPVAVQVDGHLIGSALARVHWELDLLRAWRLDPGFYVDQGLVPIYHLLLVPPPFSAGRASSIVEHLNRVPELLAQGRENVADHAVASFARHAVRQLADTGLETAMAALMPSLPERERAELPSATSRAVRALAAYRDWLVDRADTFSGTPGVGADSMAFFLHNVALLPYPASRLREMGRQEWDRAVALEAILVRRYRDVPPPALAPGAAEEIARQADDELAVRRFHVERGILGQPDDLRHYRFAAMPPYVEPLTWLGTCNDLTSPARTDEDAFRYVPEPDPSLPYFFWAKALDPRTAIVHEGVHAQQLALSWKHPDPIRRHYYDSAANEGIAFYNEELMLSSGLFDDAPASALFIVNSMRLRALRVEVDLGLALGDLTLDQAADRLAEAVPMDRRTAWEEAAFFAGNPGQGLSYQIGKLQVLDLLTAAATRGDFDLQAFHDRLWREGNVPLALQRWELLGERDQLDEALSLAGRPNSGNR